MCQRKIITKEKEWTVPLMTGCACPMIKEFHHINNEADLTKQNAFNEIAKAKPTRRTYSLPTHCYDIHTSIPIVSVPDHHVVFRNCICNHFTGLCMKLPPLLYQLDEEYDGFRNEEEDDEVDDVDENFDGNVGIRPRN